MKTQHDQLFRENTDLMRQNQEMTNMYLSNRSKLRELEILKKKQADKIAVLEEEVEEKEEEKDAMLLKVEYFRNLVE